MVGMITMLQSEYSLATCRSEVPIDRIHNWFRRMDRRMDRRMVKSFPKNVNETERNINVILPHTVIVLTLK